MCVMASTVGQARVCPARMTLVSGGKKTTLNKNNSVRLPVGDNSPDCDVSARERGPVLPDHLPPEWQAGHHLEHWIAYNSNKADMKHIANMLD